MGCAEQQNQKNSDESTKIGSNNESNAGRFGAVKKHKSKDKKRLVKQMSHDEVESIVTETTIVKGFGKVDEIWKKICDGKFVDSTNKSTSNIMAEQKNVAGEKDRLQNSKTSRSTIVRHKLKRKYSFFLFIWVYIRL